MAFSLSANLGRMRLSRCSRSTRKCASCCQPRFFGPGSNSSGSLRTGTEHATRVGRNLPRQPIVCVRCWLQTGQVNHSRPPRQPQCCWPLPDASGGSWRGSPPNWPRKLNLAQSQPSQNKGGVAASLASGSHCSFRVDHQDGAQSSPQTMVMSFCESVHHLRSHNPQEVCGTGIRTMQQESPGRLHVRKCGNPIQQSLMGLGSSGQVRLHKFIMAKWSAQHLVASGSQRAGLRLATLAGPPGLPTVPLYPAHHKLEGGCQPRSTRASSLHG